jgi:anti-sigma factor RsiW
MKMKCRTTKLVSPYLDGELKEKEKALFEAHLRGCSACSGKLAAIRGLHALFAGAERYHAPYGFTTRVMAKAAGQGKRRFFLVPVLVRFAEAAVVLAMITVGVMSGSFLMNTLMGRQMENFASSFSLEIFEPAPPNSVGGVYLAMTEAQHEK